MTNKAPLLVGYYPGYATQAQNYPVADIPASQLTHVIYAFANVSTAGKCVSGSPAEDKINFPQLLQLKQNFPRLRTLISVGGAAESSTFPAAAATQSGRQKLAQSCVQFMKANGFDGIDIDWEFPSAQDTQNFTALLVELRQQLDAQGTTDKRSYLLTIAAPAGPSHYYNIDLAQIHPQLSWINLMTYNFYVASSAVTNLVAPLFPSQGDPAPPDTRATHYVDAAVRAYLAAGVPAEKVVMGVRFVATGWQGVPNKQNGLFQSNKGPAQGTWDKTGKPTGNFGYQDLKQNYLGSYSRFWNADAKVPWLYNPTTQIMISYEDQQSLGVKADYAIANNLGGIMVWQLAADDQQHSLLSAIAGKLLSDTSGCGLAIAGAAQPGQILGTDECAFTTYALSENVGLAQPTVAFWGPGQTIASNFGSRYQFVGGVVFKNGTGPS